LAVVFTTVYVWWQLHCVVYDCMAAVMVCDYCCVYIWWLCVDIVCMWLHICVWLWGAHVTAAVCRTVVFVVWVVIIDHNTIPPPEFWFSEFHDVTKNLNCCVKLVDPRLLACFSSNHHKRFWFCYIFIWLTRCSSSASRRIATKDFDFVTFSSDWPAAPRIATKDSDDRCLLFHQRNRHIQQTWINVVNNKLLFLQTRTPIKYTKKLYRPACWHNFGLVWSKQTKMNVRQASAKIKTTRVTQRTWRTQRQKKTYIRDIQQTINHSHHAHHLNHTHTSHQSHMQSVIHRHNHNKTLQSHHAHHTVTPRPHRT